MTTQVNETHDPKLTSWVESANQEGADFPIQNLPFGVFTTEGGEAERVGVAIGDQILDVFASWQAGAFEGAGEPAQAACQACAAPTLNPLMALTAEHWSALRRALQGALKTGSEHQSQVVLKAMAGAQMVLPVDIGDYTDFYCSIYHATNVGKLFRPDNPLLPNYKHIPIGYHGRASSVVLSGTPVRRPKGQVKPPTADEPTFVPTRLLDYELEVGFFAGTGNALGESVPIEQAERRMFGFCLVNDWSARDVQGWEYQPLGPFLAKSFVTSISPWVITNEALAPFRVAAFERADGDPQPLPHLDSDENRKRGGIDVKLEVLLRTEKMRDNNAQAERLSLGNFKHMYWTAAQMLTHHSSNGCNLRPGDLMASGTVSGPEPHSRGCLLEITRRGAEPVVLSNGEERKFLQDGDELLLTGWCEKDGAKRIGFGQCTGVVIAA